MTNDETKHILEEIAARNGNVLLPDHVVEEAKDVNHPFHDRFEWDDAKAGHAHRINQARALIRSVQVVVTTETRQIKSVFYVPNPEKSKATEQGYVTTAKVRSERDLAIATITREFSQVEALLVRVRDLATSVGLDVQAQLANNLLRSLGDAATPTSAVVDATENEKQAG